MGLFWLLSLIAVGNFSTIILMRREGIKRVSMGTTLINLLVIPIVTFAIVAGILHLVMIYD
ncbi:MAG: hypothetical protein DI537_43325 [Stutzerimonas stutzeri]|nr:MAG: hypothetical protein DI537_43325 [Stutzerimonas stutzeri]